MKKEIVKKIVKKKTERCMLMIEEYFGCLWHHSWLNAVNFVGGIRREGPKLSLLGTYDLPNR